MAGKLGCFVCSRCSVTEHNGRVADSVTTSYSEVVVFLPLQRYSRAISGREVGGLAFFGKLVPFLFTAALLGTAD